MKIRVQLVLVFSMFWLTEPLLATDSDIEGVYQKKSAAGIIYRLWLYEQGYFVMALYERNKITFDSGAVKIKKQSIALSSSLKGGIIPSYQTFQLYKSRAGLHESRFHLVKSNEPVWEKLNDLTIDRNYNPVTDDTLSNHNYYKSGTRMVYVKYTRAQKRKKEENRLQALADMERKRKEREEELITISETKQAYLQMVADYLPEYAEILTKYYCGPGYFEKRDNLYIYHQGLDSIFSWTRWNLEITRMDLLETTIHESVHKANYEYLVKHKEIAKKENKTDTVVEFILSPQFKFNKIDRADIPKSEFIYYVIPDEFIFRRDTFLYKGFKKEINDPISPRMISYLTEKYVSANVKGIYGLLNEFSAYFHGFNATLMLYERADSLFEKYNYSHLKDLNSSCLAYYEFKLFIAWYLTYTKECEPEVYQKLISDAILRRTFTEIDIAFSARCTDFENIFRKHWNDKPEFCKNITLIKAELENRQGILNEFAFGKDFTTSKAQAIRKR
jgi:hypothetical protein